MIKKPTYCKEFRDIFERWYENTVGVPYYWTGKDAAHAKQIAAKILFLIKKKEEKDGKQNRNDEREYKSDIVSGFEYFLSIIRDPWIMDNLSMAIINSKFNEIIAKRDGKSTKQRKRESDLTGFSLHNIK